mmetsp:Transcript_111198/g.314742  ORF Transcript_111198/g.314742 Transcript_111198/m.314742 type:complete len:118 (+) Transcript_111198:276-629(+)
MGRERLGVGLRVAASACVADHCQADMPAAGETAASGTGVAALMGPWPAANLVASVGPGVAARGVMGLVGVQDLSAASRRVATGSRSWAPESARAMPPVAMVPGAPVPRGSDEVAVWP